MTTASNPTRMFTFGALAFAALLTACGGGGGDGGTGPAPVTRASVDKETIQSIQGEAVDGGEAVVGLGQLGQLDHGGAVGRVPDSRGGAIGSGFVIEAFSFRQ